MRLLELKSGSIRIDGEDLADIPRNTIRERLCTITQDCPILIGNVRLNVDPHGVNDDGSIIAVLEKVDLWSSLDSRGGLELELNRASLSHGQWELLALARAILRGSKIILLDEPTSHIDQETDRKIQDVLKKEFAGCTTITVAHRIETIENSDMIIVMEGGEIVESGKVDDLVKKRGTFWELIQHREQ